MIRAHVLRQRPKRWTQKLGFASRESIVPIYSAEATATGGREGEVKSADGNVVHKLTLPRALGGTEELNSTNPETLFAAGYSACFLSAMKASAQKQGKELPEATNVTGIVHIGKAGKGFGLAVELKVRAPGWPADAISRVVEAADALCPYSNAIRGNVDVKLQPLTESDTG